MSSAAAFYVYLLVDPRDGQPFYVGKGSRRHKRAQTHLRRSHNAAVNERIAEIRQGSGEPRIEFVLHTDDEQAAFAEEERLIALHGRRFDGGRLVNRSIGGEGESGWSHGETARERIRQAAIRMNSDPEFRKYLSDFNRGKTLTPEHRAKIAEAHRGKTISDEARAALVRAARNRPPPTAEHRAKVSAALRGRKMSPEAIARRGHASRGKNAEQWRARIAAALTERVRTDEARLRQSQRSRAVDDVTAEAMRERHRAGDSYAAIARAFGVGETTAHRVIKGQGIAYRDDTRPEGAGDMGAAA
jgi:hypothetical protein